jgi:putative ABC transport system permease protein
MTAFLRFLETTVQDVHFGLRTLRRKPSFTVLAVLTLALGIGPNTAMFSVIDQVLLAKLPYKDPSRVVFVSQRQSNGRTNVFSVPDFLEWKQQSPLLQRMSAFAPAGFTLGTGEQPERIPGARFSADMFYVLGVSPALGRAFTVDEDRPGSGNFVLLSDALWKNRFAARRDIIGAKVDVDGEPHTVLGVMPPGFYVYGNTELAWKPMQMQTQDVAGASRTVHAIFALARLDPGMTATQGQAGLDAVAARLHQEDPHGDAGFGVSIQIYKEALTSGIRAVLWLLMGCVGFVLLIASSNVANLLLARATGRQTEFSMRSALGASRARLVRQLLTESFLLALLGGLLGLFLAAAGLKTLFALRLATVTGVEQVSLNGTALFFTTLVCFVVAVLFGIAPSLMTSRVNLSNVLRETSSSGGRSMGKHRMILVVAETALASILLIGAGLSLKSLWRVARVDPGFNSSGLLTFRISAPVSSRLQPDVFYRQIAERVRALPGVHMAFLARDVPMSGTDPSMPVAADGNASQIVDGQIVTRLRVIGPGYFRGFQTPLVLGREFTEEETSASQPVVVISESLAHRYWPGADPIGRRLRPNIADAPWYTVVGVAADVRHWGLDITIEPTAYYPYTQIPKSVTPVVSSYMTVIVRSSGAVSTLQESIRRAVAEVNKTVPAYQFQTLEDMLLNASALRRFDVWLLGTFAGLALLLAAVGVYGVMAYSVSQRTREIGIRMALGAQRHDVMRMVVFQGFQMALAGVVLGGVGALALTRVMASLLYEVSTTDLETFVVVVTMMLGLMLCACFLPSLHATRIDPIIAIRQG